MIRSLVSIEVDLASSLAIRFVCQLGGLMEMEINPVYVKESVSHESVVGAGWASRTWEREMIEDGKKEIAEMIASERNFCPVLNEPKVVYGDREAELLKIMLGERFDLFVEGVHFPWNPGEIHKRLHTKLYQRLEHPIVFVHSVKRGQRSPGPLPKRKGTRGVIKGVWTNLERAARLLSDSSVCRKIQLKIPDNELLKTVNGAAELLRESGCSVSVDDAVAPNSEALREMLTNYGLVAIAVERGADQG